MSIFAHRLTPRSFIALLLVLFMALTLVPSTVSAATESEGQRKSVIFTGGRAGYAINGVWIESDATPYVHDNRLMVPVRFAAAALGAEVNWDATARSVAVTKGHDMIQMSIGHSQLMKNGELFLEMETPAVIQDIGNGLGRTMIPVSRLARALNVAYEWDLDTQTATFLPLSVFEHPSDSLVFETAGLFGPAAGSETIHGDVIISTDGVTLQNLVITGNLVIAQEVGEGAVYLNNLVVKGDTLVYGGGADSLYINGGEHTNLIIFKSNGRLRVVVVDAEGISLEVAESARDNEIILEGNFNSVVVMGNNVKVTTKGDTTINTLYLTSLSRNVTVSTSDETLVENLVVNSPNAVLEGEGTINRISGNRTGSLRDERTPSPPPDGGSGSGSGSDSGSAPTLTVSLAAIDDVFLTIDGTKDVSIDTNATSILAVSDNDSVATVTVDGFILRIEGVAQGTAEISVTGVRSGYLSAVRTFTIEVIETTPEHFFIFESSTGTITGYDVAGGLDVVIPPMIDGVAVERVGRKAFEEKGLTSVSIPGSVRTLGDLAFYKNPITSVVLGNGLTTIGQSAFYNNQLTRLVIPDSVMTIGSQAFHSNQLESLTLGGNLTVLGDHSFYRNQLTSLSIPDGVTQIGLFAFSQNQLDEVHIGSSVITIGIAAFQDNRLTDVDIPNSVTTIDSSAFARNQLTRVTLGSRVITIGDYAFNGSLFDSIAFPEGLISIGSFAFEDSQLTDVTIPDSVTTIGDGAFLRNSGLTRLVIGSSVETIGKWAFQDTSLTELVIPDSVTTIDDSAFRHSPIQTLHIGDGVLAIGNYAFSGNQLTRLELGNSIETIGEWAFGKSYGQAQLESLVIPDSVVTIGLGAFAINGLTSLHLGSGVETIGDSAFQQNSLVTVEIPDSVTTIGKWAFYGNKIEELILGNNVTLIDDYAFNDNLLTSVAIPASVIYLSGFNSNKLTSIVIPGNVTTIGLDAFSYNNLTEIVFPDSVISIARYALRFNNDICQITIGSDVSVGDHLLNSSNNNFRDAYEDNNQEAGTYTGTRDGDWIAEN